MIATLKRLHECVGVMIMTQVTSAKAEALVEAANGFEGGKKALLSLDIV
jgi:hypothetical protein